MASGWAGTGVTSTSTAQARYAVLNEDAYSVIQTNANVNFSSTTAGITFGDGSFQKSAGTVPGYNSTAVPGTGTLGQMISIISNGGKIAYWDTINSRWSYVKDDTAV